MTRCKNRSECQAIGTLRHPCNLAIYVPLAQGLRLVSFMTCPEEGLGPTVISYVVAKPPNYSVVRSTRDTILTKSNHRFRRKRELLLPSPKFLPHSP